MQLKALVDYCNEYLSAEHFKDYCPNGLQVEGRPEVNTLVCGVTACEALIDRAIELNADAVLVHHGYFWKGEKQPIVGLKANRIRKLIKNDISLIAYHLPLDAHIEVGNNAQLARLFKLRVDGSFYKHNGIDIALYGELEQAQSIADFSQQVGHVLNRPVHVVEGDERLVKRVAWCSGGAQNAFEAAIDLPVDAYVSGEISENTFHLAKESGVHYLSAGHHATERYGVQALAKHLEDRFNLSSHFVDIDNPV